MEQHIEKKKNEFLDRASQLLDNISLWLRETDLKPEAGTTTIKEARTGPYQSPVLSIFDEAGKKIASIEPVGAWVIGAEGRVDIIGSIDSESFVYMKKGGPVFFSPVHKGNKIEKKITHIYKGIDCDGWYWIEDKKRRKAHLLSGELFMEILTEVTDYDF